MVRGNKVHSLFERVTWQPSQQCQHSLCAKHLILSVSQPKADKLSADSQQTRFDCVSVP